jgi:glycogen synthase
MIMPSRFEPCGLPQMIGPKYGSLPIVHDTGGLHDTVEHLDHESGTGNGFVFAYYDTQGLRWGIEQAMHFFHLPSDVREAQVRRVMEEASKRFHHDTTSDEYIRLYEAILERPVVSQEQPAT